MASPPDAGYTHLRYGTLAHEHQSPPRRTFNRLSLEHLEAREVPANYVWAPPAGMIGMPPPPPPSFTTLTNWRIGLGPTDFATELPDGDDHLYFIGGVSRSDCTIPNQAPTAPTNAFAGIHLNFGLEAVATPIGSPPVPPTNVPYSGTVTIADSFAVGELEVDCGAIAQADPNAPTGTAGTLTINGSLDWTGGTLNSSTTPGTIALASDATGIAEPSFTNPGINGTVELGSDLTTLGSSSLTLRSGTYNLSAEAAFEASGSSHLIFAKAPVPQITPPPPPVPGDIIIDDKPGIRNKGMVTVDFDSTAVVQADDPEANPAAKVVVTLSGTNPGITNHGTVKLTGNTEVVFKPVGVNNVSGGFTQSDNSAVTEMSSGAKFTCQKQTLVYIDGGILRLLDKPHDPQVLPGSQSAVEIENETGSTALMLTSDGVIERPTASKIPLTLKVRGAFDMNGQVKLLADPTVHLRSDQIDVTKKIEVGQSAKVKLNWFDVTGTAVGVGDWWTLLQSAFDGVNPITDDPQFVPPAAFTGIAGLVAERNGDNNKYQVMATP